MTYSWVKALLPVLLLVSASWTNPDGSQGYSEARCEFTVKQPVDFYCGRESRIDWQFAGKRQRVLVNIGGTHIAVDGVNVGPGMIEIDGETRRYDEQGWVR